MNYFTYILYSGSLDRFYTGSIENISMRLKEHMWNHKGFTSKAKEWELKYSEMFGTKAEATRREMQIKKWKSRRMIEKLIHSKN